MMVRQRFGIDFGYVVSAQLKRKKAQRNISQFFAAEDCEPTPHFVLCFAGHGRPGSGDWVFSDGHISLADVWTWWQTARSHSQLKHGPHSHGSSMRTAHAGVASHLSIIADCCYSGELPAAPRSYVILL